MVYETLLRMNLGKRGIMHGIILSKPHHGAVASW